MNHLLTFAQFIAHRFAKEHNKTIIVRESKRMTACLGSCQKVLFIRIRNGAVKKKIGYLIRLNINALDNFYTPEETRDVIDHELAHTLCMDHSPRFKRICAHMGIHKKSWTKYMGDD